VNVDSPRVAPMYTPGFAPPELYIKGAQLGPWSDIYSIGAAMYACMAGSAPQPADQRRTEDKMDPLINKLIANYSVALVEMVRNCLALDPLVRPQSVFSLQQAGRLARAGRAPRRAGPQTEQHVNPGAPRCTAGRRAFTITHTA
jgi:serine/threonine protein kinase